MFSDPREIIKSLELEQGSVVADLGAGTGAYSMAAAKELAGLGRVYAIDVQKDLLSKLRSEAAERKISNIETMPADIEEKNGIKLGDNTMDAVIIANSLFQFENKTNPVSESFRILRPGGKILLVDWQDSFGGMGPSPDHVVSEREARSLFEEAGFVFERAIPAGEHHYGVIIRKPRQ